MTTSYDKATIAQLAAQQKTINAQQVEIDLLNERECRQTVPIDHDFASAFAALLNCLEQMGSITMTSGTREAIDAMKCYRGIPFEFLNSELKSSGGRVDEFCPIESSISIAHFINEKQDDSE